MDVEKGIMSESYLKQRILGRKDQWSDSVECKVVC